MWQINEWANSMQLHAITSSVWRETFLFFDLMLLNILFAAFLDDKYFTVGMDVACSVPAKGALCLKENSGFFNDAVIPFFKTPVVSMWVELGWAWAFSEILSINNHNHLTQNPSVPTRSETSEQCGWTVRNKQPTHISILCSQIQGATRRLKQPSDQIQAAWRSPELLQRVKDALRPYH